MGCDRVDDRARSRVLVRQPRGIVDERFTEGIDKVRVFLDEGGLADEHRLRPAVFAAVQRLQVADHLELALRARDLGRDDRFRRDHVVVFGGRHDHRGGIGNVEQVDDVVFGSLRDVFHDLVRDIVIFEDDAQRQADHLLQLDAADRLAAQLLAEVVGGERLEVVGGRGQHEDVAVRDRAEQLIVVALAERLRRRVDGQDAQLSLRVLARDVRLDGGRRDDVVGHLAAELHLFAHQLRERERGRAVRRVDVGDSLFDSAAARVVARIVARIVARAGFVGCARGKKYRAEGECERGERQCQKLFHICFSLNCLNLRMVAAARGSAGQLKT